MKFARWKLLSKLYSGILGSDGHEEKLHDICQTFNESL